MSTTELDLKNKLSPLQYLVTRQCGTEPPFNNAYWNNKADGIYVDIISGKPLFSSNDKFDSGTGWPSFTRPINQSQLIEKNDTSSGVIRTEVRSKESDSHLGHVFKDGPNQGLRYCINSASLRFIPLEEMDEAGYANELELFKNKLDSIVLAGGCFWGMEELLRTQPSVIATMAGYAGGSTPNPSYEIVSAGKSGHAESVRITYFKNTNNLENILLNFFSIHDPTQLNRQGNDIGTQYRSAIFVTSDEQKQIAQSILKRVQQSNLWKRPIVTEIKEIMEFYPAENHHQKYLKMNPRGYTCHFDRKFSF